MELLRLIDILRQLVAIPSVTPCDQGAQLKVRDLLAETFPDLKFRQYNVGQTSNMWMTIPGALSSHLAFVGHTDVVPADRLDWKIEPFELTQEGNLLYGRGVVDMKGAIACFIYALERLPKGMRLPNIHLLLTSDEEGSGEDGMSRLLEKCDAKFDVLLIGEPTSSLKVGDCIKIGRRGSLHAQIVLKGKNYHVAYPGDDHPIACLPKILQTLPSLNWDTHLDSFFPSTSVQCTKVQSKDCVENIIPSTLTLRLNFRYSPMTSPERIEDILRQWCSQELRNLAIDFNFRQGATPWRTTLDIDRLCAQYPDAKFTADGGVSDGYRLFQAGHTNIFELGLKNESAHHIHEHTSLQDLLDLTDMYQKFIQMS